RFPQPRLRDLNIQIIRDGTLDQRGELVIAETLPPLGERHRIRCDLLTGGLGIGGGRLHYGGPILGPDGASREGREPECGYEEAHGAHYLPSLGLAFRGGAPGSGSGFAWMYTSICWPAYR